MNKLLVTGLAIGKEAGECQVCNYDMEWLKNYPSIFLWADQILVTKYLWGVIQEESLLQKTYGRCSKLVFEMAKNEGLIEIVESPTLIYDTLRESIKSQIETDLVKLQRLFPDKINFKNISTDAAKEIRETVIDGIGYCPPRLWTIYASLALSKAWKAECLFNQDVLHYLRYKFSTELFPNEQESNRLKSFSTIFEAYFPNAPFLPHYAFANKEKCDTCKHEKRCKDSYLIDLEKKFYGLLKLRNYDELQEIKATIDLIIKKCSKANNVDPNEVAIAFREKQMKLQKKIKKVFPKVKRWANITTIVSIPLITVGVAAHAPLISLAGVSAAGLAKLGTEYVQYLESKNSWVGFLQKQV